MLVRTSGIFVPKYHRKFNDIKNDLCRSIVDWDDSIRKMNLYIEVSNGIIIPRWYPVDDHVVDIIKPGCKIHISSKIVPRNERQIKSIEFYKNNKTGILQLEPGSGKTVISIHSICELGRKTIILTHKLSLVEQWKKEFLNFTDIKEEDIGILETSKISEVLKKPIIISTVQTIVSALKHDGNNILIRDSGIGVAIFDECHTTVGPEVFSKVSLSLNCKRVYGLSATPRRFDNQDILEYHLGKITYFKPEDGELLKPSVYMLYFNFGVFNKFEKYIMWGGKFQYSRYEKQMFKVDKYLNTVSKYIRDAYLHGDRNILVLGKNINTLVELAKRCGINKEYVGAFIPTATKEQMLSISDTVDLYKAFHDKKVVFSTYQACRDGNNRKDLDCLFLTVPTSNIEQAIGRILRTSNNKKQPIVIDFVDLEGPKVWSLNDLARSSRDDKVGQFIKSAEKRIEIYKQMGWNFNMKKL